MKEEDKEEEEKEEEKGGGKRKWAEETFGNGSKMKVKNPCPFKSADCENADCAAP